MDSTGRSLIGGALGAALGHLLSQKGQGGQQAGQQEALAPQGPLVTAAPTTTPPEPVVSTPMTSPAAVPPSPAVAAPISPGIQAGPATPGTAPVTDKPASTVPPAPMASAVPMPPAPAAPTSSVPPAPVAPGSEPEVIVTRQFLEEPLPGAGWSPSVPSAVDEETIETPLEEMGQIPVVEVPDATAQTPMVPAEAAPPTVDQTVEHVTVEEPTIESVSMEEVAEASPQEVVEAPAEEARASEVMGPGTAGTEALAQAADVAGRMPVAESALGEGSRVDDLKTRIEETRRRIRHELEQPFETSSVGGSFEGDWTTAPAVPLVDKVAADEAKAPAPEVPGVAEAEPVSSVSSVPVEETVAVESPAMETVEVESLPIEQAVVEQEIGEEVVTPALPAEPVVETSAQPPVVEPAQPEPTPQPKAEPTQAPEPTVQPTVEPAQPEPSQPEPSQAEPSQPVSEPSLESIELDTTVSDADLATELGMEEPVDYDSMKNRIESTRSRLKAKAFDAMMTGEAALLGRDAEGAATDQGGVPGVDDEVDETIETSLREEEE